MNKRDAIQRMVEQFDAISQSMIQRAFRDSWEDFNEMLPSGAYCHNCCELYTELEEGEECPNCQETLACNYEMFDSWLPMWGWMWEVSKNFSLTYYIEKHGTKDLYDIGFRVYECDEGGIYLGIDGAGYDFYSAHWNKLYDLIGLKWHSEE